MPDAHDDTAAQNRRQEILNWKRRQFLQRLGVLGAGVAIADRILLHPHQQVNAETNLSPTSQATPIKAGEIPRRKLGRTGVEVSALTLGGFHLGVPNEPEAIRIVQEALDAGVTFMDNAWEYNEGVSEQRLGKALQGRRDKAFVMTKVCTHGRDRKVAMQQLEQSLRRLKTDYIDLWQVHEVVYDNDPERHFSKGGVIEALDEAKQQGKVRFVGFTGHKDPAIHLKMLSYDYPFDTVQLPLNCFDASFRSFEKQVLPELNKRGIAAIGMKSLGGEGEPIKAGVVTVQEALRYAMSLPVATTVSGIDSLQVLRQNLNIARGFTPMTPEEMQAVRSRYATYAADGRFELYKTSKKYDGPPGREQHGFPPKEQVET
ncbi:aldo/keto reductase [Coleofasciculus sp. FACHB-64]|uniref:aldo/keto reductase n=1 Tax=Cyanophyceae TaxID=3028117 RepID=UPI001686F012|nr:aldo/keto reductase [Coleofasciculus sp. FACHB-64]MBD2048219.1 aldo/keto reductase [Coleofasciculus sp. FACHB-64]